MTYARREIYDPDEVSVYHCISRCVRRAFLCGTDKLSGNSFEHRRNWIRWRLIELVEIFAIEVVAYAVMNNHLHSLLRTRPDIAQGWSDEEVARRWRQLFPLRRVNGKAEEANAEEIDAIVGNKDLVECYRKRLCNLSWFNRCLNEKIARMANGEDKCKGRFWEGRFKCQKVADIAAIVACSAYIDLNPIRAGLATSLEESDYTSVQQRLLNREFEGAKNKRYDHGHSVPLVSIKEITETNLTLEDYLELVDRTGRVMKLGKGHIPDEITPILNRLKITPEGWIDTTSNLSRNFKRIVAPVDVIIKSAARAKKGWFHGLRSARLAFG
ncbi:MAG: hypothetical protein KDD53_04465 [Bdellovibrionales bacterium]|nr:hypothetical protein [Bdellovibrionales bacterium]